MHKYALFVDTHFCCLQSELGDKYFGNALFVFVVAARNIFVPLHTYSAI